MTPTSEAPRGPQAEQPLGPPTPRIRRLTPMEGLGLFVGSVVCIGGFATVTELVVHRWLRLTHTSVAGAALLFFGLWWVLAAARRLKPGAMSTTRGSALHPALLAYASSLPQVATLAFIVILVTSAIGRLVGGW